MDAYALTISEAASMIAAKELSPVELTESVLARIEQVEPLVNAFVTVTAEQALAAARTAEAEIATGAYRGPLHGIPLGVKDIYETADVPTTASSKVRADYSTGADSAVVARLAAAGMIMVGKTHTHEFAMGAFTPTTGNPWNTDRIPGGSSGGSGAAVAAGECFVGLGSDTGGSIRIPASLCGTVGLKPTYGLVSRAGVASVSWSLDHVGPLTKTVRDTAVVMDAMAGYDRRDPATVEVGAGGYASALDAAASGDLAGLRVGVPTNWFFDDCDLEVEAAARAAIAELERLGATLVEVEIPLVAQARAAQQVILRSEAAAYHRRMLRASGDLYTDQVRQFMAPATMVLAIDYIDAQRIRTLVQQAWSAMVTAAEVDVIAAPTCPIPAPSRATGAAHTFAGGLVEDPHRTVTRYSGIANLTGIPSLTLPVGSSSDGLPIGLQLMGRPFDEPTVLRAGYALEQTRTRETPVLA